MKCAFMPIECPDENGEIVCEECPHYKAYTDNESLDEAFEIDAHSCSASADCEGYCQVCGSIVHGSIADYEEHGYDPPGTY